jgi:hypothetical protein
MPRILPPPQHNPEVTCFARIPEAMDAEALRLKYEVPIVQLLKSLGHASRVRSFILPAKEDGSWWVGIEIQDVPRGAVASIVQVIADCGASAQTVIEIEDDKTATVSTLGELMGR